MSKCSVCAGALDYDEGQPPPFVSRDEHESITAELRAEVAMLRDDMEDVGGGVEAICYEGHRIFIDDGEGTVYACPACALELARGRLDLIRTLADETLRKHISSSAPWAVSLARSIKRVLDRPAGIGRNPWTMRNSPSGQFLAAKAAGDVFKGARRED